MPAQAALSGARTVAMDFSSGAGVTIGNLIWICCAWYWIRRCCCNRSSSTSCSYTPTIVLPAVSSRPIGAAQVVQVGVSPVLHYNRINLVLYVPLRGGEAGCACSLMPAPVPVTGTAITLNPHIPVPLQGVRPQWQHGRQAVGGSVPRRAAGTVRWRVGCWRSLRTL